MNILENTKEIYENRKDKFKKLSLKQKQTINFISALRLIIFIAGLGFSVYLYLHKKYYLSLCLFFITIILFIILVKKHNKVIKNRNLTLALINLNEESIERVEGKWREFKDYGEEFIDIDHNFSYDLDLFGKNSLYQWINCCTTFLGRKRLRDILAYPNLNIDEILKRQEAIEELSVHIGWRQKFKALGEINLEKNKNPENLLKWAKEDIKINKFFKMTSFIMPIITIVSIIYYFLNKDIGYYIPLIFIGINAIILKIGEGFRAKNLDAIYEYKKQINTYYEMILLIESKNFKSSMLINLKQKLINKNNIKASKAIDDFKKISNKVSDRSNLFNKIINLLFLWDYHLIDMLLMWKKIYGKEIEDWFNVIGEFEALSSLAIINFDNKTWTVPNFINNKLVLKAQAVAHPLLKNAVSNDCIIGEPYSILLITGSNMSGKSTFLRTLGINLVLAYSGSKVCAKEFICSLMNIYTCMRISDNLEKNISSFYAEILRIKNIIKNSEKGEPIFFLLDEIFKGTNSIDRHLGAEALINKLSYNNTIGLVSTHDLELGDIETKNKKVKNFHFEEYYKNNEIKFDYKLREGISNTRNAVYLMRLAGINFDGNNKKML